MIVIQIELLQRQQFTVRSKHRTITATQQQQQQQQPKKADARKCSWQRPANSVVGQIKHREARHVGCTTRARACTRIRQPATCMHHDKLYPPRSLGTMAMRLFAAKIEVSAESRLIPTGSLHTKTRQKTNAHAPPSTTHDSMLLPEM